MRRFAVRCLCGLSLTLPATGCFETLSATLTPSPPVGAHTKDATLPARQTIEVCLNLGGDFEKSGHLGDAILQYEKARALDPKLRHLSRRLAVLYDRIGEENKALEEYAAALKQTPKDSDLLNDLGYCHYNRGRWNEAEKYFRQALSHNPEHRRATMNLGLTFSQQGKADEAMTTFLKVNRPAEAKANLAFVAAAHGKKDLARQLYREALDAEPALASARNGLASLDATKKDPNVVPAAAKAKPAVPQPPAAPTPDQSPVTINPRMK